MNSKKKRRKNVYSCNPPHDCFNCPFPDCKRSGGTASSVTKAESEFLKGAGLAKGRHGKNYCFPLVSDIIHSRPGGRRIV